jgi:heat shock protein HslJ
MIKIKNISTIFILLLILITLTSACSSQQAGADIINIQWQWTELFESEPASQSIVPNPENYTITFNSDGSMNIQADCNMVSGTFSVDGTSLTLVLGPSTLAFCGEESLDLMFTKLLSNVDSYDFENDQLVLHLENDLGKMTFNK